MIDTCVICKDADEAQRVGATTGHIAVPAQGVKLAGFTPLRRIILMPDVDPSREWNGEGSLGDLLRKRQITLGASAEFIRLRHGDPIPR